MRAVRRMVGDFPYLFGIPNISQYIPPDQMYGWFKSAQTPHKNHNFLDTPKDLKSSNLKTVRKIVLECIFRPSEPYGWKHVPTRPNHGGPACGGGGRGRGGRGGDKRGKGGGKTISNAQLFHQLHHYTVYIIIVNFCC